MWSLSQDIYSVVWFQDTETHGQWCMWVNSRGLSVNLSWIHPEWRKRQGDGAKDGEKRVCPAKWLSRSLESDEWQIRCQLTERSLWLPALHRWSLSDTHTSEAVQPRWVIALCIKQVNLCRKNNTIWLWQTFPITRIALVLNRKTISQPTHSGLVFMFGSLRYCTIIQCPVCDLSFATLHAKKWPHAHTAMTPDEWALRWTLCVCPRSVSLCWSLKGVVNLSLMNWCCFQEGGRLNKCAIVRLARPLYVWLVLLFHSLTQEQRETTYSCQSEFQFTLIIRAYCQTINYKRRVCKAKNA